MRSDRALGMLGLFLALAACAAPPEPAGPRIETADDFLAALRQAGIEVEEAPSLAPSFDLAGGEVFQLGPQRIEVYRQGSEAEQRAAARSILQSLPADSSANVWGRGTVTVVYDGLDGPTIELLSGILGDSLNLSVPDQDEPYPPAVVAAIGWLAQRSGSDPGAVTVEDFEMASWPDACLGLAQAGETCADVITSGWRVTLSLRDQTISLRTDDLGLQIREEPSTG